MYSMKMKVIALLVLTLVAGQFMLGCSDRTPTPSTSEGEKSERPDLEVSNVHSENGEFGFCYVCGTVTNNTDQTYSYVQVEINLYDDSGQQVGNTFDNVNNLEPGGSWNFRALVMEEKATKYKVVNVSGW